MSKAHVIIYNGKRYNTLKEFAAAVGIKAGTLHSRLKKGMTPEEAVREPVRRTARPFVPCTPSDYNCLHCTKPDCACDLPLMPGETTVSSATRVHFKDAPAFAQSYRWPFSGGTGKYYA